MSEVTPPADRGSENSPGDPSDECIPQGEAGFVARWVQRYGYNALRMARRISILVIGVTVLLVGVLGIILPGLPAVVLLPAGLAILSIEFLWARKLLIRLRTYLDRVRKCGPSTEGISGESTSGEWATTRWWKKIMVRILAGFHRTSPADPAEPKDEPGTTRFPGSPTASGR